MNGIDKMTMQADHNKNTPLWQAGPVIIPQADPAPAANWYANLATDPAVNWHANAHVTPWYANAQLNYDAGTNN